MDLVEEDPDACWQAILTILGRQPPERVLGILAAGPLEDLIQYHGPDFIERIESEACKNPAFKQLLGGVWKSSTEEVWARVQKAQPDA